MAPKAEIVASAARVAGGMVRVGCGTGVSVSVGPGTAVRVRVGVEGVADAGVAVPSGVEVSRSRVTVARAGVAEAP